MNYELALRLRNAGFPQKESYYEAKNFTKEMAEKARLSLERGDAIIVPADETYRPTLSELIEACEKVKGKRCLYIDPENEEKFYDKYDAYITVGATQDGWRTGYMRFEPYEGESMEDEHKGSTPEEAVANLWLALNEKSA